MNSTRTFKQYFLSLYEDITTGSSLGGTSGFNPSEDINSSDFYAPGDARIPKGSVVLSRRGKVNKKRKKKK